MSTQKEAPLLDSKPAAAESATLKAKCKNCCYTCCKKYGPTVCKYGGGACLIIFILMWILQGIIYGIWMFKCNKGYYKDGVYDEYTYADGECEVDNCATKKYPSSATSENHTAHFNLLHMKMILKEAEKSQMWGSSFDVYDMQGNTNDPAAAAKGKWWRKWGPFFNTYFYQESSGSYAHLIYMRESVNPFRFTGVTHIIGRCDEEYPVYFYQEGAHWFKNLFVHFSAADKGWQFDIEQEGKFVATAVESKNAQSLKFYADKSTAETSLVGSAAQHQEGAGLLVKGEWNVDNRFDIELPYYVTNAITLLLAFTAYNKEQAEAAEAARKAKEAEKAAQAKAHEQHTVERMNVSFKEPVAKVLKAAADEKPAEDIKKEIKLQDGQSVKLAAANGTVATAANGTVAAAANGTVAQVVERRNKTEHI
mmetsp:Transcript_58971/g.107662  ORF Transcript_58971/g.107662 Transcript_58971/m.107662 type:complete len:422 (+) Transcript_58971:73-1338(+)